MKTSARILSATLLLALALSASCKPGAEEGTRRNGRTYTVRGQVTQLPDPAHPGSGLYLSHEAVDGFVDRDGKTVGMDPMNMPFPVAPGVDLAGLAPADVVEFDLNVDWQAEPAVEITRVRKLPPGTKLVFRAAEPDKAKAH
jgi:hypothetical protein